MGGELLKVYSREKLDAKLTATSITAGNNVLRAKQSGGPLITILDVDTAILEGFEQDN